MDNTKIAKQSLNHSCFNKSFLFASTGSQTASNHSASLQFQIFFITVLRNLQYQPKFAKTSGRTPIPAVSMGKKLQASD